MKTVLIGLVVATLLVAAPPPAAAVLQKGQPAPPLEVVTTSGQKVTLANYKGYVLIIDFFATWCVPCERSIPHLLGLNARYGRNGLQILGVSVDDDEESDVRGFATQKKLTYPVALAGEEVKNDYLLRSLPTVYVINKKGLIAESYRGYNDNIAASMTNLVKKLLAE